MTQTIEFIAPPTCGAFMDSEAFFRIIVGPVGSGKTTSCLFEMLKRAALQRQGPDGIRRTRWAITRQTLGQLKMTVLLDILNWLRPIATYKVSEQLITIRFADIVSEWYMVPLEDEDDQKRLLSMQLTGAWLNEAIEISPDLVIAVAGRCGRFPGPADGGCTWHGLIADTNAPIEGSPWHQLMEDNRPPDWQVFTQPSGLDDDAENLEWLLQTPETLQLHPDDPARRAQGRKYYERLARGRNEDWIRRYVHAKYGEDPTGTAVFRGSFKRSFHVKPSLEPVIGQPIIVGQDFGRNPCSLICQPDHTGRLLVLEEVIGEDVGLELHITFNLKPKLYTERYFGRLMAAVGDPSGVSKGNFLEENSFDVMHRLGIPAFPATTNNIDPRVRAVETLLLQQRDGGGAVLIDESRCPMLVRALNGAYRYGKTKAGETKPVPEKLHPWSDLADDLQYVCLALNSGLTTAIYKRLQRRVQKRERRPAPTAAGWT
jgi:hypothetical protein